MVTIQELIASTGLPPDNRQRLWRVMQQYGYAAGNAVVVGVRRLTPERGLRQRRARQSWSLH